MVLRFLIGDFLSGRRIQWVPAVDGSWSEELNGAGDVQCTVSLRDPAVRRLELPNSATEGKAYLAAVDGDTVLQAGPIYGHSVSDSSGQMTLFADGAWKYLDARAILPYPTTDPTAVSTDLTSSLQGIVRALILQAMSWPNGNVPFVLPDEIPGAQVRNEPGSNLAMVGERLRQMAQLDDGPDIQFQPRFQADRLGVEWVVRIGTPTQPELSGMQDVLFRVGVPGSSVSGLQIKTSGTDIASRAYASGGRSGDTVLIRYAENGSLISAGYPARDRVNSSFSTVVTGATMQAHAAAEAAIGSRRVLAMSFDHSAGSRPYVGTYTVGDFARVRFVDHHYFGSESVRARITRRSGSARVRKVHVELQPEAS